ncbi:insulin-induced protein-domain-containing protein [Apodospora peruviana]|uniref:Insulin-induced protein-domain-containing protein n=1 Tax=Apodospora peruviana TaxID=516989 RepID=A0AAE0HWA0_9PEZI|nr:insulin-induced protein-domain-containing protein [Apodospora peruviana]
MDSPQSSSGDGGQQQPQQQNDGPKIIRPIPRRPFKLALNSPTPPEEDSLPNTPPQQQQQFISANDLRFLNPHQHGSGSNANNENTSLSRAASLMNLTSSTLFGIYSSPTSPSSSSSTVGGGVGQDYRDYVGGNGTGSEVPSTPWGTGAETPAKRRPGLDEETYKLMRSRSSHHHHCQNSMVQTHHPVGGGAAPSRAAVVASLVLRAALLFGLGMGYGVLVTRLPSNRRNFGDHHDPGSGSSMTEGPQQQQQLDWRYLAFWGGAGVALGSLLPWFDSVWEETFGKNDHRHRRRSVAANANATNNSSSSSSPTDESMPEIEEEQDQQGQQQPEGPETDWALVVRGIGAFVGIVFAIRRLPWTSTMQVSLTLALANPFLWYLIDRSKPGFLLSAAVGVAGSVVLMGLGLDMMPAPFMTTSSHSSSYSALNQIGSFNGSSSGSGGGGGHSNELGSSGGSHDIGGGGGWFAASNENIEAGVWMLSVLFCSCVCFGNIGRRLALNRSAATRGRWGGVR